MKYEPAFVVGAFCSGSEKGELEKRKGNENKQRHPICAINAPTGRETDGEIGKKCTELLYTSINRRVKGRHYNRTTERASVHFPS